MDICDLKQKIFLWGFKYWDESRPSREDYRSGLHHGNKSLTAWPNPVKTNNKLHHLCYYYYMLEVIQGLNFRSGINNKRSMFLEWWNTSKSLSNIWRHFSCLLDKGTAKICMKFNSHNGFLRADQGIAKNCCQKPKWDFNFLPVFAILLLSTYLGMKKRYTVLETVLC